MKKLTTVLASFNKEMLHVILLIFGYIVLNTLQGIFTGEKITFLLKDELHLSASTVTSINLLIYLPTYVQPFMGACTELYPLFGSRRRSYFILASLTISAAWLLLAFQTHYNVVSAICCLLIAVTGFTLRGVLINAITVAMGNKLGNYKGVQTVLQLLPLVLMATFAGRLGGIVTEHWSYRAAFSAAAGVSLCYLFLLPLLKEPDAVSATPAASAEELPNPRLALRQALKDRRLWAVTAFVAYFGLVPSPDTARPYYLTDALHLSKLFIGELSGWGALGAILGVLVVQVAPRRLGVRSLAAIASSATILAMVPLMLIHDALSAKIGILVFNILASLGAFAYSWMWARACPKGLEAVIFGTLASTQALFYFICDWLGTHMYDWFGPATGHSAAYGWHWTLITCMALGAPLFLLVLLLPKTDPADDHLAAP
jgi:MFS family permease